MFYKIYRVNLIRLIWLLCMLYKYNGFRKEFFPNIKNFILNSKNRKEKKKWKKS